MPTTSTPTDSSLAQAIAQTEAELAQLQERLTDLRKPPTPPPATAGTDEIIAASLKAAQAAATAAPTASGIELAITRLQTRLAEQQSQLAQAQAAATEAKHQAAVKAAHAKLEALGAELERQMAAASGLICEVYAVAQSADLSFKALQVRPEPIIATAPGWRPKPLLEIYNCKLPRLVTRPDGTYGMGFTLCDPSKEND
jgi:uncharacterized coiled-coil protein SlyX